MSATSTWQNVVNGDARWCVEQNDCRAVLGAMPDRSVGACLADPPYSRHVHGKARAGTQPNLTDGQGKIPTSYSREVDFGFAHLDPALRRAVARQCARVVKRWSAWFCDIESAWLWRLSAEAAGLEYIRTGIWHKLGGTPQFTGDRPATGVEAIVFAHPKGRKKWNGGGSHAHWAHLTVIERGGQRMANNSREHPTQKPLSLMLELVELFTDPGEIVLDCFAGSGTTGVACLRLGRRFIGIELDPKHAQTARDRLAAEESGSTLQAARAGQVPLFGVAR